MCAEESSIAELLNRDYGITPLRLRLLGSFLIEFGGESRLCCLFRWIEGESVDTGWPENDLQQIGHIVGTLHSLSQQFVPPALMARPAELRHSDEAEIQRVRDPEWLDWLKAHLDISRRDLRILSSAIEIVSSELRAPRDEGWNSGLCHGDLHPGNMIVTPDGMAVIDFDQLAWGLFDVELAWLLSTTVDVCPLPKLGKRETCLAAYQKISSLPFSSKREFGVRVAFFHLLHFDWLHSLSDPKILDEHSKTMRTRIGLLRDFISE